MEVPSIGYIDMAMSPSFSIQQTASYYANTAYFIPIQDWFALAVLNSPIGWFIWSGSATLARGGVRRLFTQFIEGTPIPAANDEPKAALAALAQEAQAAAEARLDLQRRVTRRIPDLAADPATAVPSTKLREWWTLPDFSAFRKEVVKSLKADIPLKERND